MNIQNAIKYPFAIDQYSGRTSEERDFDAYIVQLIKQTLLTNLGERINRPDFGSNIRRMVFSPNNPASASFGKTLVYQALTTWLSEFILPENIEVSAEEENYIVSVEYRVIANGETRYLNVELL